MRTVRWVGVVVGVVLALAACDLQPSAPSTPTASATAAPSVTASATATPASESPSPIPTRTPTPTPSSTEDVLAGRTNPKVTPDTVQTTICVAGYTAKIRPPYSETSKAKAALIAREHPGDPMSAWILDHVVPLEGGGAPGSATDLRNFMLQAPAESHVKDRLEDEMRDDICSGRVPLHTAQVAMADGWQDYAQQVGDR